MADSRVRPWLIHTALKDRIYAPVVLGQLAVEEFEFARDARPDSPCAKYAIEDAAEYARDAWHAARKLTPAQRQQAVALAKALKFEKFVTVGVKG